MQCTQSQGYVYPGKAIDKQNQDYAHKNEQKIHGKGNEDAPLNFLSVLKEHGKSDESRQKSQNDTQRIQDVSVVQIFFIKKIEEIRKLADYGKGNSKKTEEKHNEKLNRNAFFYRITRSQEDGKIKLGVLYELRNIKAVEKSYRKIADKHQEIADAHHVKAHCSGVSTKKIGKCIEKKQACRKKFDENERSSTVLPYFIS